MAHHTISFGEIDTILNTEAPIVQTWHDLARATKPEYKFSFPRSHRPDELANAIKQYRQQQP